MRDEYPDQYGFDSLPHLKSASKNNCDTFVTFNEEMLKDRDELYEAFGVKILTPDEAREDMANMGVIR